MKQIRALLIKNTSTTAKLVIAGVSGVAAPVYSTNITPIPRNWGNVGAVYRSGYTRHAGNNQFGSGAGIFNQ